MTLTDRLLGKPLASSEVGEQKIGVLAGVPTLGLDGLSSAAYGPEAALTVLIPLGVLGLNYALPITLIILGLLTILYFSYRQTIAAYPTGGGSYTVAKENLGVWVGLLAAAALMLDYTLNVAVGISAGIEALVSAVPALHKDILPLCLVMLALVTVVNLRGAREAGVIFALPTYLFIVTLLGVIGFGLLHHGHSIIPPPRVPAAVEAVSAWLLIKAFASGCTAMTGVEAVSNGVTAFAKPTVKNAQWTLTAIVGTLAVLLLGIAFLAHVYHIGAMDESQAGYQSVIAQLVAAVMGKGAYYYITLAATLSVLTLSANTSYAGFPRLCRLIAMDDYLPHAFTLLGRRLVYTFGIVFLTGLSAILLIAFGGITDRLIPLFAVGAFLAFTLSQTGMVVHWKRQKKGGKKRSTGAALAMNGIGAAATAGALVVIIIAKFVSGAWITLIIIPALLILFSAIKRHYAQVTAQTRCLHPLDLSDNRAPVVIVPVSAWNMQTERALRFALRLSPDVVAVHMAVSDDQKSDTEQNTSQETEELKRIWSEQVEEPARQANLTPPSLEIISSPYRRVIRPTIDYIERIQKEQPDRLISVVVPELVEKRWWALFLHNHLATGLKASLLLHGDHRVVVINVPWYLKDGGK